MDLNKKLDNARIANDCRTAQEVAPHVAPNDLFRTLIFAVSDKQQDFTLAVFPYLSEKHRGEIFDLAVESRNNDIVRALLPHSDPLFNHSCALQMASATQNQDIFDLLYPVSDPLKALKVMKKYSRAFEYRMLEQRIEELKTKKALNKAVKKSTPKSTSARSARKI